MKRTTLFLSALLSIGTTVYAQIPSNIPQEGLIGYYPFSGNTNDLSGNANDAVNSGAVLTTDRNNNANSAYSFDGVDDYMAMGQVGTGEVRTINFWIKSNSTALMQPFKKSLFSDASGEQFGFHLNWNAGSQVGFAVKTNSNCMPATGWNICNEPTDVTDDSWHMITATVSQTAIQMYIDGLPVTALVDDFSTLDVCSGDIEIGRNWDMDPRWYQGAFDDLSLWDIPLDACQVKDLYNNYSATNTITEIGGTLIANASASSYQWYYCANNSPINGATTSDFIPTVSDSYYVVSEMNGCFYASDCFNYTLNGINEDQLSIGVYPNPASDKVMITTSEPSTLTVHSVNGRELFSITSNGQYELDVTGMSPGVYLIRSAEGKTVRFIRE